MPIVASTENLLFSVRFCIYSFENKYLNRIFWYEKEEKAQNIQEKKKS